MTEEAAPEHPITAPAGTQAQPAAPQTVSESPKHTGLRQTWVMWTVAAALVLVAGVGGFALGHVTAGAPGGPGMSVTSPRGGAPDGSGQQGERQGGPQGERQGGPQGGCGGQQGGPGQESDDSSSDDSSDDES